MKTLVSKISKKKSFQSLFVVFAGSLISLWSPSSFAIISCDSLFEEQFIDPVDELMEKQGPMDLSFLKKYKISLQEKLGEPLRYPLVQTKRPKRYEKHLIELVSTEFYDDRRSSDLDFIHRLSQLSSEHRVLAYGFSDSRAEIEMLGSPDQFALAALANPEMMGYGRQEMKFTLAQYMVNQGDDRLNNAYYTSYLNQASILKKFLKKSQDEKPQVTSILQDEIQSRSSGIKPALQLKDIPEYDFGYASDILKRDPYLMRTLSLLIQKLKVGGVLYLSGTSSIFIDSPKFPVDQKMHRNGENIAFWLKQHAQGLEIDNPSFFHFAIRKTSENWSLPDAEFSPEKTQESGSQSLILRATGKGIISNK